jgi:methyl-accepting chemotaxis protein
MNLLSKISIGKRMILSYALIFMIISLVGLIGINNLNKLNNALNRMYNNQLTAVDVLHRLNGNSLQMSVYSLH